MQDQCNDSQLLAGRYEIVSPLNHGSFGMVSLARDIQTNDMVAMKCIPKPTNEGNVDYDNDTEELRFHEALGQHPHIVNLYGSFETETHLFIVLEFCSMGDLYEAIRMSKGPLETEHVRDFMLQLISAVEHMHSRGVYHRDIKPENIFLTPEGDMKLGDFGLATTDEWSEEVSVGSDRYMAPEQYDLSSGAYSPAKADIWAVGICLLNVLFARNPFSVPTEEDPLFSDFVFDRQSLFDIFPTMSSETFDVLNTCLTIDPSKRSLSQLREAVENVRSWTTDDEVSDDEFCTEDRDVVTATTNREPLRTPSITTPQLNFNSGFPWAQAIHVNSQQRQLSTIYDNEPFHDGFAPSSYDSGLGESYSSLPLKSNNSPFKNVSFFSNSRIEIVPPKPLLFSNTHIQTSPAKASPTSPTFVSNASVAHIPIMSSKNSFSKPTSVVSTSWSDWVDEDEEEEEQQRQQLKDMNRRTWSWDAEKPLVKPKVNDHFFDTDVFGIDQLVHDQDDDSEWVTNGYDSWRL